MHGHLITVVTNLKATYKSKITATANRPPGETQITPKPSCIY